MLKNYVKLAIKVLLRRKFFTFISLFGISFTLIVLMLVSAFADHLLKPIGPEKRSDNFLLVHRLIMKSPDRNSSSSSSPGYRFLDRHVRTLESAEKVAVFSRLQKATSFQDGRKIDSKVRLTDGVYWQILDFDFVDGAPFGSADERDGNFVAVISKSAQTKLLDGAPAIGQAIEFNGQRFRVVGVVDDVSHLEDSAYSEIWVPISTSRSTVYRDQMLGDFNALVLAGDRDGRARIKEEFRAVIESDIDFPDPKRYNWAMSVADTKLERMAREMIGDRNEFDARTGLLLAVAFGAMLLFMLLPAINLININVSRILERSSEIGIRKAFGASSRTLIGQFIVENVILTALGGLIGFVGSFLLLEVVGSSGLVPYAEFQINARIFAYGIGLVLFFGVLSGVYPAWKMSRLHPVEALRGRA